MKLVNADLLLEIEIEENNPAVLVLENPKIMTEVTQQLFNLCLLGEGGFILSENGKQLSFDKYSDIIVNPFAIDFNSRKIQNKLYAELLEEESLYLEEKANLQTHIIEYLERLSANVPYEMITHELDLDSARLLKMFEVRLDPQYNTLLEKIVEYVKVLTRLLRKKLLIFVCISSYLEDSELLALNKMCSYQKMKVLFLETQEHSFSFPVNTYIIDKDKCLIIK